jgi:hypothetical protein
MKARRRSSRLFLLPLLFFVCALLVVPAATFHSHADGREHTDCPICLNALAPAELTSPSLPGAVFCGFSMLPSPLFTGPAQRLFTGNNQLSCGPPRD